MRPIKLLFLLLPCLPGFCFAQQTDTTRSERSDYHPKISAFILPAALIGYGLVSLGNNPIRDLDLTTKSELQEDHPLFAAHADDYLQFAPAIAVYALNLTGVKGKHNLADATGLYLLSEGIMTGAVTSLKNMTKRLRPNGSGFNSFPSGHTANAFASAEFLNQEYKDSHPWIGYAGYTVATATGVLRMYNNRHWLSDVIAGAGFGILSTKISYLVYPRLKQIFFGKGNSTYNLVPAYQNQHLGFSFDGRF